MIFRRLIYLGALMFLVAATGSSVSAEEAKMNAVQTALSSTTISGYADTSVEWSLGDKNTVAQPVEEPGFGRGWRTLRNWIRAHGWRWR